jgi:hypothetical protein
MLASLANWTPASSRQWTSCSSESSMLRTRFTPLLINGVPHESCAVQTFVIR